MHQKSTKSNCTFYFARADETTIIVMAVYTGGNKRIKCDSINPRMCKFKVKQELQLDTIVANFLKKFTLKDLNSKKFYKPWLCKKKLVVKYDWVPSSTYNKLRSAWLKLSWPKDAVAHTAKYVEDNAKEKN